MNSCEEGIRHGCKNPPGSSSLLSLFIMICGGRLGGGSLGVRCGCKRAHRAGRIKESQLNALYAIVGREVEAVLGDGEECLRPHRAGTREPSHRERTRQQGKASGARRERARTVCATARSHVLTGLLLSVAPPGLPGGPGRADAPKRAVTAARTP